MSKDPEELELFRSECAEVAKVVEGTSDLQPVRDRQLARFNISSPSSIFSKGSNLLPNLLSPNSLATNTYNKIIVTFAWH